VNEENGTKGAKAYRDAHLGDLEKHVLAIESDSGIARPSGFGLDRKASPGARETARAIAGLLRGLGAHAIAAEGGGADIGPIVEKGVLGMSLAVDESRYFDTHHTHADTFEKIDRTNLGLCAGSLAVMAYVAADLPARIDGR
jgi:carboxypeptidase Q